MVKVRCLGFDHFFVYRGDSEAGGASHAAKASCWWGGGEGAPFEQAFSRLPVKEWRTGVCTVLGCKIG